MVERTLAIPRVRALVLGASLSLLCGVELAGCAQSSCLDASCGLPCAELTFACTTQPLYVGRLGDAPAADRLRRGNGGDDDVLISNGVVSAVISAIDTPNDLAPTGGNLVDLGPAGGVDDLTILYQLAGILPDDAFSYRTLEISDRGGSVAVTLRGTLDARPEVHVVTHYELRPCDPGIRVHSELWNGSPDVQAFMIADASHWGKRRVLPFVVLADHRPAAA